MKENKFKKQQIMTKHGIYTLKEEIAAGAYSCIYTLSDPNYVIKLINPSHKTSYDTYQIEKKIFAQLKRHTNLIYCQETLETTLKDCQMCCIIMEYCPRGCLFDVLEVIPIQQFSELQILRIAKDILQGLHYLHSQRLAHRDIKVENILYGSDNNYKICDFGSVTQNFLENVSKENRQHIQEEIERNTTPQYRSPEQLDLFSGFPINEKVDIFALGVVLFILCFQKPPFESALAAINGKYFLPDKVAFSAALIDLLLLMFTQDPRKRPSAEQLLQYIDKRFPHLVADRSAGVLLLDNLVRRGKKQEEVTPSIFSRVKKVFSRLTSKSEGWLLSALEQNEQGPKQKYVRYLIVKAWKKREKVEKQFNIIHSILHKNIENTIIVLKILILMHNYFKKGPPECFTAGSTTSVAITVNKNNSTNNNYYTHGRSGQDQSVANVITSNIALNILGSIKQFWTDQLSVQGSNGRDKRRNQYTTELIKQYTAILTAKVLFCGDNREFFEGNYSLTPFLQRVQSDFKPLTPALIDRLFAFLQTLISYQDSLLQQYQLWSIQCSLVLAYVDEEFCLISLITHLLHAFKQQTNFITISSDADRIKLQTKIAEFDRLFEQCYSSVHRFFLRCGALKDKDISLSNVVPNLNLEVIDFIKQVPTLQNTKQEFHIFQFLNNNCSIFNIKLPYSYGSAVSTAVTAVTTKGKQMGQAQHLNNKQLMNYSSEEAKQKYSSDEEQKPREQQQQQQKFMPQDQYEDILRKRSQSFNKNIGKTESKQVHFDAADQQNKNVVSQKQNLNVESDQTLIDQWLKPPLPNNKQNQQQQLFGQQMQQQQQQVTMDPTKRNSIDFLALQQKPPKKFSQDIDWFPDENALNNNNKAAKDEESNDPFWEFSHQNMNNDFKGQKDYQQSEKLKNVSFFDIFADFGDFQQPQANQQQQQIQKHQGSTPQLLIPQQEQAMHKQKELEQFFQQSSIQTDNVQVTIGLKQQKSEEQKQVTQESKVPVMTLTESIMVKNDNTQAVQRTIPMVQPLQMEDKMIHYKNEFQIEPALTQKNSAKKQNQQLQLYQPDNFFKGNQSSNNPFLDNQKPEELLSQLGHIDDQPITQQRDSFLQQIKQFKQSMLNYQDVVKMDQIPREIKPQQKPTQQQQQKQQVQFPQQQTMQKSSDLKPAANDKVQLQLQMPQPMQLRQQQVQDNQQQPNQQLQPQLQPQQTTILNQQIYNQMKKINDQVMQARVEGAQSPKGAVFQQVSQPQVVQQEGMQPGPQGNEKDKQQLQLPQQQQIQQQQPQQQLLPQQQQLQQQQQQPQLQQKDISVDLQQGKSPEQAKIVNKALVDQQLQQQIQQQQIPPHQLQVGQLNQMQLQISPQAQYKQLQNMQVISPQTLLQNEDQPQNNPINNNQPQLQKPPQQQYIPQQQLMINQQQIQQQPQQQPQQLSQQQQQQQQAQQQYANQQLLNQQQQFLFQQAQLQQQHTQNTKIELKHFLEHEVCKGNSCQVYKGMWRGQLVAVKKMQIQNMQAAHYKEFQREIVTLVKIKPHKNLVQLMGIAQNNDNIYIITQFCAGGSLFDILHRRPTLQLKWGLRVRMCVDIAQGIQFLHGQPTPIIHRDLKSLNLLLEQPLDISKPEAMNIKIADFGLSRPNDTQLMTGVLGTFHWMAPEIFECKPYSTKADVYSFGVVVWEICARQTPYQNLSNPHAIMKFVTVDKGRPDLSKIPKDCPSKLTELIQHCWNHNPDDRPDFTAIILELNKLLGELQ